MGQLIKCLDRASGPELEDIHTVKNLKLNYVCQLVRTWRTLVSVPV